ncbi:YqiJ family protein [bacterium]|nr:YqiJ family protein [bacterium]
MIPLGLSALLILVNAIGLSGDSDADVHHEIDVDHDVDVDHDIPADVDSDHAVEHHEGGSSERGFIEFLGAGKIPITLIFQIFFLSWGISGWILNVLLRPVLIQPWAFIWISILGALIISAFITRSTAKLIWRYAPLSETYAKHREELIGREGESIYAITQQSGMAQIYDERGSLHRIYCRVEPGAREIAQGEKILIIHYDQDDDIYLVKPSAIELRTSNEHELSR